MFYAALDVSVRSVAICIIDEDGKVRLELSVPSDVPDIVRCFNEFGQPIHQMGLEAGTLTQHLTYGLTDAGFDVVCMEARQVNAALSAMRDKTDKKRCAWHRPTTSIGVVQPGACKERQKPLHQSTSHQPKGNAAKVP